MVLDRIDFMNKFLNEIDSDRKMKIIRDCFVSVMSCYNIALSYNANNIKIIDHSDDYNIITLEISTDKGLFSQLTSTLKTLTDTCGGLSFEVYSEKFRAEFIQENTEDLSVLIKIYKILRD